MWVVIGRDILVKQRGCSIVRGTVFWAILAVILVAPLATAGGNVTVVHQGSSNFAMTQLADLGCQGSATIELIGDALRFEHNNGTTCASATMILDLPPGAAEVHLSMRHVRLAGAGLLSTSIEVAGGEQVQPLAAAHSSDRDERVEARFIVTGSEALLTWRFDAAGDGGVVVLDDLHISITSDAFSVQDLARGNRLEGDFVDERQLAIDIDATPVSGLRPEVTVDMEPDAVLGGVLGPNGNRLQVDGDGDTVVLPAPLLELHGSGQYVVLYRTPTPVAAQAGLLAWFIVLMMSLIAATGMAGYLTVRHMARPGNARYVSAAVYSVLVVAAGFTVIRVLFSGDLFMMVRSPLSAIATTQYVILGVLTVAFGVLAAALGARQMRFVIGRLRVRAKHAQQLEEQQEQMETFTAAAAHDLRAPLRTISGHVALARRCLKTNPERAEQLMDRAVEGTKRMDELVTALLDHSRVTNAEPEPLQFSIEEATAQAITDLHPVISERNADVAVEGGARLNGDPRLIRQAIQNLIQNAIKYSAERPWVRIRIDEDEEETRVRVVDRGRGIPHGEQQRVLQAFERASNSRDTPGTGLGLATVRKIMQLHDGDLLLASEEGQGTTFTLRFPKNPIDEVLLVDGSPASDLSKV